MRFDIYSPAPSADSYDFTGTVTTRLNVISDPKQIKEHLKQSHATPAVPSPTTRATTASTSPQGKPQPQDSSWRVTPSPYAVSPADTTAAITTKFLALIALGPITRPTVEHKLDPKHVIPRNDLIALYNSHTQAYLASDTFIEDDMYPIVALGMIKINAGEAYVILKDKAYKELRPGQWSAYTDYERALVLENANSALSRLGYLDTHPLRKRIADTSASAPPLKKHTGLGGGLLAGSKRASSAHSSPSGLAGSHTGSLPPASPLSLAAVAKAGRAATDSPELDSAARNFHAKKLRAAGSPVKETFKRKFVPSLSLSAASSEDEKGNKRLKTSGSRSNSNGSSSSANSNVSAHSVVSHGTPPSSANDDGPSGDRSDDDVKLLSVAKHPGFIPSRPSSAVSSAEKKHQYYAQLASKFRTKYTDYENLYKQLKKGHKRSNAAEKKKQLMRLFEMHNSLAEWKKKLWDYHNDNNLTEGIMNLSKHRKHPSLLGTNVNATSPTSTLASLKFTKAQTTSPAVASDRFGTKPPFMRKLPATPQATATSKMALDY